MRDHIIPVSLYNFVSLIQLKDFISEIEGSNYTESSECSKNICAYRIFEEKNGR